MERWKVPRSVIEEGTSGVLRKERALLGDDEALGAAMIVCYSSGVEGWVIRSKVARN